MWLSALWLACGSPGPTQSSSDCDPAPRAAGEVRARRIQCKDEILPSGEARLGDLVDDLSQTFEVHHLAGCRDPVNTPQCLGAAHPGVIREATIDALEETRGIDLDQVIYL